MLQELCIHVVASIFEDIPELKGLDPKTTKKVIDILPIDLPLELAGTVSDDVSWPYWRAVRTIDGGVYTSTYCSIRVRDIVRQESVQRLPSLKGLPTFVGSYPGSYSLCLLLTCCFAGLDMCHSTGQGRHRPANLGIHTHTIAVRKFNLSKPSPAQHLLDEDYWKRRSSARWRNLEPSAHGNSWKQLYFEKNLQDALEQ